MGGWFEGTHGRESAAFNYAAAAVAAAKQRFFEDCELPVLAWPALASARGVISRCLESCTGSIDEERVLG